MLNASGFSDGFWDELDCIFSEMIESKQIPQNLKKNLNRIFKSHENVEAASNNHKESLRNLVELQHILE